MYRVANVFRQNSLKTFIQKQRFNTSPNKSFNNIPEDNFEKKRKFGSSFWKLFWFTLPIGIFGAIVVYTDDDLWKKANKHMYLDKIGETFNKFTTQKKVGSNGTNNDTIPSISPHIKIDKDQINVEKKQEMDPRKINIQEGIIYNIVQEDIIKDNSKETETKTKSEEENNSNEIVTEKKEPTHDLSPEININSTMTEEVERQPIQIQTSSVELREKQKYQNIIKEHQEKIIATEAQEIEAGDANLNHHYSDAIKSLEGLSKEELRTLLIATAAEMNELLNWETRVLANTVRQAKEDSIIELEKALNDQAKELEAEKKQILEKINAEAIKEFETAIKREEQSIKQQMDQKIAQTKQYYNNELQKLKESDEKFADEEFSTQFDHSVKQKEFLIGQHNQSIDMRINELKSKVKKAQELVYLKSQEQKNSLMVNTLTATSLALLNKLQTSDPAIFEVHQVLSHAQNDDLLTTILESIPNKSLEEGVPTLLQLNEQFSHVRKIARHAAFVPKPFNGVGGYLISYLFSMVYPVPQGNAKGDDIDSTLARVAFYLEYNSPLQAIAEAEKLSEAPRFIINDWLNTLKTRVLINQAGEVIYAHLNLINSISKF